MSHGLHCKGETMRACLIGSLLLLLSTTARAGDLVYEGTWVTTNRPLDGTMTCVITELGDNKWRGHFYGVWEGIAFSYKVAFNGPPEKLRGTAVIDGANYEWTGTLSKDAQGAFNGEFWGDRYVGKFRLKQKSR
jgi:hypothetical protein